MLCRFARDILYPSIHIYFIVAFIHTQNLLFMMREIARDENFCRIFNQFYTNLCPFCFIYEWVHLNFLFHYYLFRVHQKKIVNIGIKKYVFYTSFIMYTTNILVTNRNFWYCNHVISIQYDMNSIMTTTRLCKIIYLFKWNN